MRQSAQSLLKAIDDGHPLVALILLLVGFGAAALLWVIL